MADQNLTQQTRLHRPRSVTILSLVVLFFSGFYLTRTYVVLRNWTFWESQFLPYANIYLLVTGLVWGILFFGLAAGLWFGNSWSGRLLKIVMLLYIAFYWIERIFIEQQTSGGSNWLFVLVVTLAGLVLVFWLLSRPAVSRYVGEKTNEQ